jgi:hypothetical protein
VAKSSGGGTQGGLRTMMAQEGAHDGMGHPISVEDNDLRT